MTKHSKVRLARVFGFGRAARSVCAFLVGISLFSASWGCRVDNPAFEEQEDDVADTTSEDGGHLSDEVDKGATQNDDESSSDWTQAHDDSNSVWTTGGWQNNSSQVDSTADQMQGIESNADDTAEVDCEAARAGVDVYFTLRNVTVTAPMEWVPFDASLGYVRSGYTVGGFAEVVFEVPCDGAYRVWGLTWDGYPGGHYYDEDPDSFFISIDGSEEATWIFGCQWIGSTSAWQLHEVRHWPDSYTCSNVSIMWQLSAGQHVMKIRDREARWSEDRFPGLAGLVFEPVQ